MSSQDLALAAYLAGRIINGDPVPENEIPRLVAANVTLDETRACLQHGRANVREDMASNNRESRWRANAARSLRRELDRERETPSEDVRTRTIHQASSALAFGAGYCAEHSAIAAARYAQRAGRGEEVHIVTDGSHQWAESRIDSDRNRTVVLDAWCAGPPVLAPDGGYSSRATDSWPHYQPFENSYSAGGGHSSVWQEIDGLASQIRQDLGNTGLQARIDAEQRMTARFALSVDEILGSGIYSSPHVIDPQFTTHVHQRADGERVNAEIAAAWAARRLGRSAETARGDIVAILEALASMPR